MAPMKRSASFAKRSAKRSRADTRVSTVVGALADAEALPVNLRSLLKHTLPIVLNANKVDRHAYEVEVVEQTQQALAAVQSSLEQAHKDSLAKQNAVIAPAERQRRTAAKKAAEAHLESVKTKLENDKVAKKTAEKGVEEAVDALKAAQKEEKDEDRYLQRKVDREGALVHMLQQEFVMLKEGTSASAQGKKAVQKLVSLGKEYRLDSTLLHTFPMTCKKPVEARSEFESVMFNSLQALIDGVINGLRQEIEVLKPVKEAKTGAVEAAQGNRERAEAVLKAADEELTATHTANAEAKKEVAKADAVLRKLWEDMRHVCEAQDGLTKKVADFKENVLTSFQGLKEREPEPEPVEEPEPMEEAAQEAEAPPAANIE